MQVVRVCWLQPCLRRGQCVVRYRLPGQAASRSLTLCQLSLHHMAAQGEHPSMCVQGGHEPSTNGTRSKDDVFFYTEMNCVPFFIPLYRASCRSLGRVRGILFTYTNVCRCRTPAPRGWRLHFPCSSLLTHLGKQRTGQVLGPLCNAAALSSDSAQRQLLWVLGD